MVSLLIILTATLLASGQLVASLSPGNYIIANVQFPSSAVVGTNTQTEGAPLTAFAFTGGIPVETNTLWTVDSTMTTLQCERVGVFAVTDATNVNSRMSGAGVFTVVALNPQPPFVIIGTQAWQFIQGSNGIIIALAGTDFVWSLGTDKAFTQIQLAPLDSADLRQQWTFTAH